MKQKIKNLAIVGILFSTVVSFKAASLLSDELVKPLNNTIVLEWNEIAFKAFDGPNYQHPLLASRINAMMHIAMHDAINGVDAKYERYAFTGNDRGADPVAAASAAAYQVLLYEIPGKKAFLDSALQETLNSIAAGDAKKKGIALGKAAANQLIKLRTNDGSAGEVMAKLPTSRGSSTFVSLSSSASAELPGIYQLVPPFDFLFAPHWEHVNLFSLQSKNQFRPGPYPLLESDEYAKDFNEVLQAGRFTSSLRTEDQTSYTKFWYEFSEAGWNRVAREAVKNKSLDLFETARLFALVNIALADSYIAGWDAKMYYNFWRPYTAIHHAAVDGNDKTIPVADWEPAEPTPPVQDYPSTHSALGNAAATVLASILGDETSFTMTSYTAIPAGTTRSFKSFSEAANENAESRIMAGIHFRFSCKAGQDLGNNIGHWVVEKYLKPIK